MTLIWLFRVKTEAKGLLAEFHWLTDYISQSAAMDSASHH